MKTIPENITKNEWTVTGYKSEQYSVGSACGGRRTFHYRTVPVYGYKAVNTQSYRSVFDGVKRSYDGVINDSIRISTGKASLPEALRYMSDNFPIGDKMHVTKIFPKLMFSVTVGSARYPATPVSFSSDGALLTFIGCLTVAAGFASLAYILSK